ncbi:hypothetical protein [Bacillus sp. ISL-7]|uniref:hypothetical protein n=1 Tax=Bacillus sp. ISL-7 TaxID=2819136 RepID=UPI001BE8B19D|nr:hypothetical protein [Bacillus sp. ISL-7]
MAKRLLNGDLSVKDLKSMDKIKVHFRTVKKKRRKGFINYKELNKFVEEYLLLDD